MAIGDRVINIDQLELEHFHKGDKFESRSARVGPRIGAKHLGYSYDIVPPGKASCPFHSHRAEDVMFFIIRGTGLLRDVTDAIIAAKSDARIKLIVLDLDALGASGLSKLQEISAALREFRASGKRVVAMGDSFTQTQYYLAAQAGEIYLDPMGEVSLSGFSPSFAVSWSSLKGRPGRRNTNFT